LKILRNALAGFSGSSDAALRARGLLSLSDLSNLREIAEECYELINQGLDMEGKLPASAPEPLCIRLTMDLDGLARNVRELVNQGPYVFDDLRFFWCDGGEHQIYRHRLGRVEIEAL
jgi:hypothetical protein